MGPKKLRLIGPNPSNTLITITKRYIQGRINTTSIGDFMYMGPKLASLPGSVVQCWPGNLGVPSSNLGVDCFYAPPPTSQDDYPLSSIQNK